jgi:hypothetical protein
MADESGAVRPFCGPLSIEEVSIPKVRQSSNERKKVEMRFAHLSCACGP